MLQTTNYQLSQWEPEDRILREDFNRDHLNIDAALKAGADAVAAEAAAWKAAVAAEASARAAGDRVVTLASATTSAAAQQIDLSVSHIDFTKYLRLEVYAEFPNQAAPAGLALRVNGLTDYSSWPTSGNYTSSNPSGSSAFLAAFSRYYGSFVVLPCSLPESYVSCLSIGLTDLGCFGMFVVSGCTWNQLSKLNLVATAAGTTIAAGARIWVLGVKK